MRTERGLALGIALVVAMACCALALGLTGAFPDRGRPGSAGPDVTVAARLPNRPASGAVYRLTPPPLTRADAARIFAAVGSTAPVKRAGGIYVAGRGPGTIIRTALGWFVNTRGLPADESRGEPPSADVALAVARDVAVRLGVPAEHLTATHHDGSAIQTVTIDRFVDGRAVPALRWSVVVGPGGALEGVEGYIVDVRRAGQVRLTPADAVAHRLGDARATVSVDHLALWAVTVGTNMMGYTPVFGSSVKYVLLGNNASCKPVVFHDATPRPQTSLAFLPGDASCVAQTARSLTVTSGRRALGAVTVRHGHAGLIVPAYEFTFRVTPAKRGPRDHTLTVAAVDDATMNRLARPDR